MSDDEVTLLRKLVMLLLAKSDDLRAQVAGEKQATDNFQSSFESVREKLEEAWSERMEAVKLCRQICIDQELDHDWENATPLSCIIGGMANGLIGQRGEQ